MASILENVKVVSSIELAKKDKSKSIKTKPNTFSKTKQYWYSNKVVNTNEAVEETKVEQQQTISPVEVAQTVQQPVEIQEKVPVVEKAVPETTEVVAPAEVVPTVQEVPTQEVTQIEQEKTTKQVEEQTINIEKKLGNNDLLIKTNIDAKCKKGSFKPIKLKNAMFENANKKAANLKINDTAVTEELKEEKIEISPENVEQTITQQMINEEFENAKVENIQEVPVTEKVSIEENVSPQLTEPVQIEQEKVTEPVQVEVQQVAPIPVEQIQETNTIEVSTEPVKEEQLRDEIQIAPDRQQEYKEIIDKQFEQNNIQAISSEEVKRMVAENVKEEVQKLIEESSKEEFEPEDIRVTKNAQHALRIDEQEESNEIEKIISDTLQKIQNRKKERELEKFEKVEEPLKVTTIQNRLSKLEEMMNKYRSKQSLKESLTSSINEIKQKELAAQSELEEKRNKFEQAELEFERRLQELDDEIEKYQSLIEDSNKKLEDLSRQSRDEQDRLEALYEAIGSLA